MQKYIYIVGVFVMLLLFSCKEEANIEPIKVPITMTASAGDRLTTRAGIDIQGNSFNEGEKINAYLKVRDGEWIGNPTIYTTSVAKNGINDLIPDVQPFFPSTNSVVDVFALYPSSVNKDQSSFTVSNKQYSDSVYKANDLMFASAEGETVNSGNVNLHFSHKMAKLIITATGDKGVIVDSVKLYNICRTIGFQTSNGNLGSLSGNFDEIEMSNGGAVLIPPQNRAGKFLKIVDSEKKVAWFSLTNSKDFKSGKVYHLNVTVGRLNFGSEEAPIEKWPDDVGTVTVAPIGSTGLVVDSLPDVYYSGHPFTPTPRVMYGETELGSPQDYTYQYFDNETVGTAAVLVVGANKYAGLVAIRSFDILRQTGILEYTHKSISEYFAYNAKVENPFKTCVGDGKITYVSRNANVATVSGEGEVRMQGVGKTWIVAQMAAKNYTEAKDSFYLDIKQKTMDESGSSSISVTLDKYTYTYTGDEIKPVVTVMDGTTKLNEKEHYNVSYTRNTNAANKDAGENKAPTVIITGIGGYSGTMTETFTIEPGTPVITFDNTSQTITVGSTYLRAATATCKATVKYRSSDASIASVSATGEVTGVKQGGPVTITAYVDEDSNGNYYAAESKSYSISVIMIVKREFKYTGNEQTWQCSATGYWKLEAHGARGGGFNGANNTAGGSGGYSEGIVYLTEGTTLYIYCGGQGADVKDKTATSGGWNGGGGGGQGGGNHAGGGGGGATHVATVSGLLSTLSNKKDKILIVAGGGGGGCFGLQGGNGGGLEGGKGSVNGTQYYIDGGSQTTGYQFGQGQRGADYGETGSDARPQTRGSGGGGGGYWGGKAHQKTNSINPGSGGGGSGYLKSNMTSAETVAGGSAYDSGVVVIEWYGSTL